VEDRQGGLLEFQPEAHNDEREQGRHQGGEQHSQSFGATPSQLTRLFTLVLRKGTAAAIKGKQAIVIPYPETHTSSRTWSVQYL